MAGSEQGAHRDELDFTVIAERSRALSSPVRWQILRACLDEERTNKELADLLGVNPGSMLHHVRTLVAAGFLAPGVERRGARNAVEIPYRTTDLVWRAGRSSSGFGDFLLGKVQVGDDLGEAEAWQQELSLDDERREEFSRRLRALMDEYVTEDGSARTWSVVVSLRPTS